MECKVLSRKDNLKCELHWCKNKASVKIKLSGEKSDRQGKIWYRNLKVHKHCKVLRNQKMSLEIECWTTYV